MSIVAPNNGLKVESYVRHIDITYAIRQIINDYPLGSGIIREIIQNSDDARAEKQILVLDHRSFGISTLLDPVLARYQGPALLAYNDSSFKTDDWDNLMSVSNSKKKTDSTKAGKFGIGFNAVHHITDAPSVISGNYLAILDPHEELPRPLTGGVKLDFTLQTQLLADQLAAFTSFLDDFSSPFNETIVRIPLRTAADALRSRIKQEETSVAEIRGLLDAFIEEELSNALLFLKNLKLVEFREILETGEIRFLARAELLDTPGSRSWVKSDDADTVQSNRLSIYVSNHKGLNKKDEWLVRHEVGDVDAVSDKLTGAFPKRANILKEEKLYPHVAIALPLSSQMIDGKLFTYLPLPINTKFPVHVHALFALTSSRQSLQNSTERPVPGSREDILQRWNTHLFQEVIAYAWANILQDAKALVGDIYAFWPPKIEGSAAWKGIDAKTLWHASENHLHIWPLYTGDLPSIHQFSPLEEAVIDTSLSDLTVLAAVAKAGVRLIRPPPHIMQLIKETRMGSVAYTPVNPKTVSLKLQKISTPENIENLSPRQKALVFQYLYDPTNPSPLFDIPVIPRIDGSFVAIQETGSRAKLFESVSVIFASDGETDLFRELESRFVDRSRIQEFLAPGSTSMLDPPQSFLDETDALSFGLEYGCRLVNDAAPSKLTAKWLSKVHEWADLCYRRSQGSGADMSIDRLPLPLVDGSTRPTQAEPSSLPVMGSRGLKSDTLEMFRQLGIPLCHKDFKPTKYLQDMRRVTKAPSADVMLQWLDNQVGNDTLVPPVLRRTLHNHLSELVRTGGPLTTRRSKVLRDLPIFCAYQPDASGQPANTYTSFGENRLYLMGSPEAIPYSPRHTFLDLSEQSNTQLIDALEPNPTPITPLQFAKLAADNLGSQPEHMIDTVFKKIILPQIHPLYYQDPSIFEKIRTTSFVTTHAGRQAPSLLIDPKGILRGLFSKEDDALPIGLYASSDVLDGLRGLPFFMPGISGEMVGERVNEYSRNPTSRKALKCALKLLDILDEPSIDVELPASLKQQPWIPVGEKLVDASNCRDESEWFWASRVLLLLPRTLRSPRLRDALGWSGGVPKGILQRQFHALVHESPSTDTIESLRALLPVLAAQFSTEAEIQELRATIADHAWLPIGNVLRTTHSVYASEDVHDLGPSFFRLPEALRRFPSFFTQMGVPDVPQPDRLIAELHNLTRESISLSSRLNRSIRLLEAICICMSSLSDDMYSEIMVPDAAGDLRSVGNMVFNDRGQHQSDTHPSDGYVHPRVSLYVAKQLGIVMASARLVDDVAEDDAFSDYEQHETMQNKIRQTLLRYSYMSTCNELLANADDAGATDVSIMYDKRTFFETGALCPALQEAHRGPALVIHNNGVFTEEDWIGLREVGTGGKADKASIGRFGLGALTYFHWTDVPLIVSGNYALFLDPSGEYLPLNARTNRPRRGLRIDLRRCDDCRYDGTLEPLAGLFGFDPRNYYQGTLVRLPRRHSGSKLLDGTYKALDVLKFLSQCEDDASIAFLFTKCLQSIAVGQIESNGSSPKVLRTTGTRRDGLRIPVPDYPGALGDITWSEVVVNRNDDEQLFLMVKSTIAADSLPSESIRQCAQKHRLSAPSIGLACSMDTGTIKHAMRLMSTLGIATTQLPVHLHGEFILSSDRRTIVMDKFSSTSTETQYNEFLLGKLAPPAYLYLIHVCLRQGYNIDTCTLWPRVDASVTETLTREIYNLLHGFSGVLFETIPTVVRGPRYVSPQDAVFHGPNNLIMSFLLQIGVPNLVANHQLSPDLVPSLQFDDAAWMATFLRDKGDQLQDLFQDDSPGSLPKTFVGDLIGHISSDSTLGTRALHGLRLLPTTTLHNFCCDGNSTDEEFLIPSSMENKIFIFSRHRFLDRRHVRMELVEKLLAADVGLNIRKINPTTDMGLLLQQGFPVARGPVHAASMERRIPDHWHSLLRDYILQYSVPVGNLRSLPFIPLSHPQDHYISAESSSTLFAVERPWLDAPLLEAIKQLEGFHIFASWSDLPPGLVSKPKRFHLELFLRWLQINADMDPWTSLDDVTQRTLIHSMRELLQTEDIGSVNPSSPLAQLPIWECPLPDGTVIFEAAGNIVVLPSFVDVHAIDTRYFVPHRNFTSLKGRLRGLAKMLGATILDRARDLGPFLLLPEQLEASDFPSFRTLLAIFLPYIHEVGDLRLAPDGNSNLRLAHELFNPEVDVFRQSLDPLQLLHADFVDPDMVAAFVTCGMRAIMNAQSLKECAQAVHQAVVDSTVRNTRAQRVYETLLEMTNLSFYEYQQLEPFAFIPRQSLDLSPRWRRDHLPSFESDPVIAPGNLLLQKYNSIAWTQRASFASEPSSVLCTRWENLGKPNVGEVVRHFVTLATVVADEVETAYSAWGNGFIDDLRDTYTYLQQQSPEVVQEALSEYSATPIFLNIDSQLRPWTWASVDNLVLGIDYDVLTRGLAYARAFLHPYADLLITAGAERIKSANIEGLNVDVDDPETYSQTVLKGLGELLDKEKGNLTDVALVATNAEDPGKLRVHKVVFAATSEWFRARFGGEYQDADTAELDVSFRTLQAIVDCFYGRNPIPEQIPMDDELEVEYTQTLLDILGAADKYMLADLKRSAEIKLFTSADRLIRPSTVRVILEHAKRAHSIALVRVCRRFIEDNASFIEDGASALEDSASEAGNDIS